MIAYSQETDSSIASASPRNFTLPLELKPAYETTGESIYYSYFPIIGGSDLLGEAWRILPHIKDHEIQESCEHLLTTIQEVLTHFQQRGFDLLDLPQLRALLPSDGSVLLEWKFDDYRIGFTIEGNSEDSGWYLVSSRRLGDVTASGSLDQVHSRTIISWLFNFVLANS